MKLKKIIIHPEISTTSLISNDSIPSISFEVIVGSFSEESNAKKLISKFKKKSLKARQLASAKKYFRVSAGKFYNKENALEFQKKIKKKFKISSWILTN